ncbi:MULTISPECIES: phosphatase PAP2 family protein [Sphingobium]|uniref:phosphatase PAP2 family protein n=1 Tax=Sphingobium sp. MI1205 TaxID=407020 RepID=UPI00076FF6B1|nr:phosphatase PAP2 family protein [Sphingobium sp. MI1205]AMK19389.1 hypothetical protein K663_15055 [Sphingobium sp. MI1205]
MTITRSSVFLLCLAGVTLGVLNWAANGPLPGDVALTRGLQALLGHSPEWAGIVTKSATEPWMWAMTGVVALLLWILRGRVAALAAPIAFALALATDGLLRFFIFSPRPLPTLVAVARPSPSSGLPSTYGLITGTTTGLLMLVALAERRGWARAAGWIALVWLVLGWAARVTMGGHWTSQLLASYALSILMAQGVLRLMRVR